MMPALLHYNHLEGIPPKAVYIGRAVPRYRLKASKWSNPFLIGRDGDRATVIVKYTAWLLATSLIKDIGELRGKDLVCWCAPKLCHGEVLVELANHSEEKHE